MRLFGEIVAKMGADELTFLGARYVVLDGKSAFIENALGIVSIENEKIEVRIPGGALTVVGEDLFVASYNDRDLMIVGKVWGVYRGGVV